MKGIIHSVSEPSKYNGILQIGFVLKGNPNKWFNIQGEKEVLEDLLKKIIVKGNEISFIYNETSKKITELKLEKKAPEENKEKSNHIVNIKGKNFMTYEGVLNKLHEKSKGNFSLIILESWNSEDLKSATCKVRLTVGDNIFDGIGSSTPQNTGKVTDHPVEIANTRAKGRALRDYLNIGEIMTEEMKK